MFLIFLAILVAAVVGFVLVTQYEYEFPSLIGCGLLIFSGITGLIYVYQGWSYISAGYKVQIVNREYGTNYTQAEMYWAKDVIETVRELDRKRYQINGNLITGEPPKDNQEKP